MPSDKNMSEVNVQRHGSCNRNKFSGEFGSMALVKLKLPLESNWFVAMRAQP
jgi:hypothetical protein